MASIERRELRLPEALDDREHRRVHEADICVGVAVAQLADPRVVGADQVYDPVRAHLDVGEQRDERPGSQALWIQ